jgi:hypothetical protein
LDTIDNRLGKIEKEAKANPKIRPIVEEIKKIRNILDSGIPLNHSKEAMRHEYIEDLQLITAKPVIYLFNVDEKTLTDQTKQAKLQKSVAPAETVFVSAKLEDELRGLTGNEALELLETYGVSERGLNKVINSSYSALGLQSFLTAGEKEVRAWPVKHGSTAPQAAGAIHSDFEKGFIAAQVIDYNDLVEAGSFVAAKNAGKVRTEGKDYIIRPNDVVEFRFNV